MSFPKALQFYGSSYLLTAACLCSWVLIPIFFFFFFLSHNPASGLLPWQGGPLCRYPWLTVKYTNCPKYPLFPSPSLRHNSPSNMGLSHGVLLSPVGFAPLCHHLWHHSSIKSISRSFPLSSITKSLHRHVWSICFQVLHLLPHFSPCMHPNAAWVPVSVTPAPQWQ